jgi:hypothetical protein
VSNKKEMKRNMKLYLQNIQSMKLVEETETETFNAQLQREYKTFVIRIVFLKESARS